jgi:predicted phosphate transport protein (TIGR00153 family)
LKLRLVPKEAKFFEMFADMCANLSEGAQAMHALLVEMKDIPGGVHKIKAIEHRGDEMTHAIITKLNVTFITPFDREDIHKLASSIDDVLDFINAAADRMLMYKITAAPRPAAELAAIIVRQAEQLTKAVAVLGKDQSVLDRCVEINRLENDADTVARKAIADLFDRERDPIALIKLKELYEVLETATDKAEDAANVLESVVLKST